MPVVCGSASLINNLEVDFIPSQRVLWLPRLSALRSALKTAKKRRRAFEVAVMLPAIAKPVLLMATSIPPCRLADSDYGTAARLLSYAFLLIRGPNDSEKSSVARAGLVPRLTQPGDIDGVDAVRFVLMRPVPPERRSARSPARCSNRTLCRSLRSASLPRRPGKRRYLRWLDRWVEALKTEKNFDRSVVTSLVLLVDQLEGAVRRYCSARLHPTWTHVGVLDPASA